MPIAAAEAPTDRTQRAVAVLGAAAMALFVIVPRTSPGALALLIAFAAMAGGAAAGMGALRRPPLAFLLLAALAGLGLLSIGWAADRSEAINKSTMLAGLVLATAWAQQALGHARSELLVQASRAMLIAFAAGLAYLCIEEVSGHGLKRLVFMALPFTRPAGKQISDPDGEMSIAGYISNRNMAAVALALWPMLLLLTSTAVERARRLPAVAGLLAMSGLALTLSKHETSLIALAVSAAVFAICLMRPRIGLAVVAAGWLTATLLVVPLAGWAMHSAQLHTASWLPNSARHRIVLWAYTAEQVQHRPLLGVGAASTKLIDARRGPKVDTLPGSPYQWRSGPHAHNVYLQTWYELGAIGAALLCAAGLAVIAALMRLPAVAMPYAAAAMTTAAVTASFSWGMWQAWFLGAFAVAAVLMALAVRVGSPGPRVAANAV